MMFCSDDALFADDGAVGVGDGDGDVTETEEAYTLWCEAAAQRALEEGLDRADRAGAAAEKPLFVFNFMDFVFIARNHMRMYLMATRLWICISTTKKACERSLVPMMKRKSPNFGRIY